MTLNNSPHAWIMPQCHTDFVNLPKEFQELKSLAIAVVNAIPKARVILETPEPGLVNVKIELPSNKDVEVHSVPVPGQIGKLRFAVFISPETSEESEIYFESVDSACDFLLAQQESDRYHTP